MTITPVSDCHSISPLFSTKSQLTLSTTEDTIHYADNCKDSKNLTRRGG
jgi:hypothetical protein